jgi:predicted dehydrogenase
MEKAKAEIRVSGIIVPNPKIDSVNAAVPDHSHFPISMAAIQSGSHG